MTAVMPIPEWDTPLEWWPLERVLTEYRPGSHGDDWTWQDEYDHLLKSDEHRERTEVLAGDLSLNPMHWPICLGTDGRIWDGHHRIVAAMWLGMDFVLVEPAQNGSQAVST